MKPKKRKPNNNNNQKKNEEGNKMDVLLPSNSNYNIIGIVLVKLYQNKSLFAFVYKNIGDKKMIL